MTPKQFILRDINTWDSPDTCTRVTYKVSALWFFGDEILRPLHLWTIWQSKQRLIQNGRGISNCGTVTSKEKGIRQTFNSSAPCCS